MAPFSKLWRTSSNPADSSNATASKDASAPVAQVSSHSSEEKSYLKAGDDTIVHDAEDTSPGELTLEEGTLCSSTAAQIPSHSALDAAGGLGRHLGVFSCTMLM